MEENKVDLKDGETGLLRQIQALLKEIRYGYIQITVQDSRPVQIDKVEKFRLDKQGKRR